MADQRYDPIPKRDFARQAGHSVGTDNSALAAILDDGSDPGQGIASFVREISGAPALTAPQRGPGAAARSGPSPTCLRDGPIASGHGFGMIQTLSRATIIKTDPTPDLQRTRQ